MSARTRAALLTCTAATLLWTTACQDEEPSSEPTTSPEPTPTETTSPWEEKFTDAQLTQFDDALRRWESFRRDIEPHYAKGKATPAARAVFEEYFNSVGSRLRFNELEMLDDAGVRTTGSADILWSKPIRIKPGSVTIRQCIDTSASITIQYGKTASPAGGDAVKLRTIVLDKPRGHDWLILSEKYQPKAKDPTCSA